MSFYVQSNMTYVFSSANHSEAKQQYSGKDSGVNSSVFARTKAGGCGSTLFLTKLARLPTGHATPTLQGDITIAKCN